MPKKCLIIYASYSGNTEKVALRFKGVLEKHSWQVDMFKIDKNTNFENPPFKYNDYDFVCVGSLVASSEPVPEIMDVMRKNPISGHWRGAPYKKVVAGPKKGIVFVTYGGAHMGPKEAVPALMNLALEFEHLHFTCIGQFSCPGKMFDKPTPDYFWPDLYLRPDERDLKKAEIFMEDILELL
jgi:flavodoxin